MKREKVIFIIGLIAIIIGSITSVFATAYLYNANEVSYDNTNSNISSTNVQNAITELYDAAQDYSSINSRVSVLEDRWLAGGRVLAIKESTSSPRGIQFFNASNGVSSYLYYSPSDDETVIRADSSSGSSGKGTLNLKGNPVKINGNDAEGGLYINGMNDITNSLISLYSSTGTIATNNLRYKIVGDTLVISGRIEISIATRTGANPGIAITIPNSRKLKGNIPTVHMTPSTYTDGARYGESTVIRGTDGESVIYIIASETHVTVSAGKNLVFYVPMTYIKLA